MTKTETQIAKLTERGLQSKLARRTQIARSTINAIFSGNRRATPLHARALANEFERRQIDVSLWELLFDVEEGESLVNFVQRRNAAKGAEI